MFFQKRTFRGFMFEILRVVGLLGEKFTFFNSLVTTNISSSLKRSVHINVVLLINFPEQFELCFYFKYSRNIVTKLLKQTLVSHTYSLDYNLFSKEVYCLA